MVETKYGYLEKIKWKIPVTYYYQPIQSINYFNGIDR